MECSFPLVLRVDERMGGWAGQHECVGQVDTSVGQVCRQVC